MSTLKLPERVQMDHRGCYATTGERDVSHRFLRRGNSLSRGRGERRRNSPLHGFQIRLRRMPAAFICGVVPVGLSSVSCADVGVTEPEWAAPPMVYELPHQRSVRRVEEVHDTVKIGSKCSFAFGEKSMDFRTTWALDGEQVAIPVMGFAWPAAGLFASLALNATSRLHLRTDPIA